MKLVTPPRSKFNFGVLKVPRRRGPGVNIKRRLKEVKKLPRPPHNKFDFHFVKVLQRRQPCCAVSHGQESPGQGSLGI